jgi:uncharacterized protein (DUF2141 family)
MKSRLLALTLLALTGTATAAQAGSLAIEVGGGIKPGDLVMVAVYADDANWLRKPVRALRQAASADAGRSGRHQLAVDELPPGRYALAVYVDRNGNGKLDSGMFGIPKEPYGFSRSRGFMGPPDFVDAAFELPEAGTSIHIKLH